MNTIIDYRNNSEEIEFKIVPTMYSGACFVIQPKSVQGDEKCYRRVYIGYNNGLDMRDAPKKFKIFFTTKDEWRNIVVERWFGHDYAYVTTTPANTFPLQLDISPLSRDFYYPESLGTRFPHSNTISFEGCFSSQKIISILKSLNCRELCIPIVWHSLFDIADIAVCTSFDSHFCGFWDIGHYIEQQLEFCSSKRSPEKYFKGHETPRTGVYYHTSDGIDEDQLNRTLVHLYWSYKSNIVTVIEEKLVYGPKVT